jgi:hypothetical protein
MSLGTKGAKVPFTQMSGERCDVRDCGRAIKANVAGRIQRRPLRCYGHYREGERARRLRPAGGAA